MIPDYEPTTACDAPQVAAQSPCTTIPRAVNEVRDAIIGLAVLRDMVAEGNVPRESVRGEGEAELAHEPPLVSVLRDTPQELLQIAESVRHITAELHRLLYDA